MAQGLNLCLAHSVSQTGTGLRPCGSTFQLAPCLWPEKTVEGGQELWDPEPTCETQKKPLASRFRSTQLLPLRPLGE